MTTIYLGFFDKTVKKSVTATAPLTPFTPGEAEYKKRRYMVIADADCFISRNADAATTTSFLLPAKVAAEVSLFGTDTLSYVTASTANLYITELTS